MQKFATRNNKQTIPIGAPLIHQWPSTPILTNYNMVANIFFENTEPTYLPTNGGKVVNKEVSG